MNKVILMGRLTRDPDIRQSQGDSSMTIARYTLAVDRRMRRSGNANEQTADFINIVAFGKAAEFIEKYAHKGTKLVISGRIQTGSYTNKDGVKVYTTDVIADEQEFAESKNAASGGGSSSEGSSSSSSSYRPEPADDDFMNVPDEINEELPFND
ncbi:MAG: single-stranded DNA-binding protein [Lachnospiraceae bacterium]|nr:single-stranded DNA-binding protein [Lachnospiraceae bacterium]